MTMSDHCDPKVCTLFAYGSLREPVIQQWLFGRMPSVQPDVLQGARCRWIEDLDADLFRLTGQRGYPALQRVSDPAAQVVGSRLDLSHPELLRADAYEGPGYHRQRVTLQSGHCAWVYVEAPAHNEKPRPA